MDVHRSHEYGSTIIHSIVTGTPRVVYGNMPNSGAISNLPDNAIAEVPTLVDRSGLAIHDGRRAAAAAGRLHAAARHAARAVHPRRDGRPARSRLPGRDVRPADGGDDDAGQDRRDVRRADRRRTRDFLPPLDAKKTLVPTSGKTFAPPTPQELRASWDAAQKAGHEDDILDWKILGPFKNGADKISLSYVPTLEAELIGETGPDFDATYESGDKTVGWKPYTAGKKGYVNLDKVVGRTDFAVAYAYTELNSVHARETVLRCGSDDGIKVWVNGKPVLENDSPAPTLREKTRPRFF